MVMVVDRCATGITGFDELCQGGFVRNSENAIIGGPGSGKTTFMLQFLFTGATKYNENGLYCSFEPDIMETLQDASSFGWDFAKLNEQNKVKFMKFSPQTSIADLKSELTKLISKYGIRRVCFDPISVLALNIEDKGKARELIYELVSLMKRLKVTTIIADELLETEELDEKDIERTDVVKFISDSVTIFHENALAGVGDRAIRILKMRRTNHFRGLSGMSITDSGIQILHK